MHTYISAGSFYIFLPYSCFRLLFTLFRSKSISFSHSISISVCLCFTLSVDLPSLTVISRSLPFSFRSPSSPCTLRKDARFVVPQHAVARLHHDGSHQPRIARECLGDRGRSKLVGHDSTFAFFPARSDDVKHRDASLSEFRQNGRILAACFRACLVFMASLQHN